MRWFHENTKLTMNSIQKFMKGTSIMSCPWTTMDKRKRRICERFKFWTLSTRTLGFVMSCTRDLQKTCDMCLLTLSAEVDWSYILLTPEYSWLREIIEKSVVYFDSSLIMFRWRKCLLGNFSSVRLDGWRGTDLLSMKLWLQENFISEASKWLSATYPNFPYQEIK